VRSIHLHKDKDVFNVSELPLKQFAVALGLPGPPKIKFVKAKVANVSAPTAHGEEDAEDTSSSEVETKLPVAAKEQVRTWPIP
jgi:ATP-dependent RNA helicase DDX10/DBP4